MNPMRGSSEPQNFFLKKGCSGEEKKEEEKEEDK